MALVVFLLSSKCGGVGLNLIGASRLVGGILLVFRRFYIVWRFGETETVSFLSFDKILFDIDWYAFANMLFDLRFIISETNQQEIPHLGTQG